MAPPYLGRDLRWTDEADALQRLRSGFSPTTDHAANATQHDWRPFIPFDGGTALNSIPASVTLASSLTVFRKQLKTFLFDNSFS